MNLADPSPGSILFLGIDDFSFRRGYRFGTILVNLVSHTVVDLLPDREAETALAQARNVSRSEITTQKTEFLKMVHLREGDRLDAWLTHVADSNLPELKSFAAGIEKDKDAVRAGLTSPINNGMVEGHVSKLKLIKRQGYGRAGFPLLRKRILHAL